MTQQLIFLCYKVLLYQFLTDFQEVSTASRP